MEAAALDRDVRVGWRRTGTDWLDGMGGGQRQGVAGEGDCLHQYGCWRGWAEFWGFGDAVAAGNRARGYARGYRSEDGPQRLRFVERAQRTYGSGSERLAAGAVRHRE